MSIQGNLETFYLSSLLQMLSGERKTGRLKIRSRDNEVQIILHEGDIVFATEKQKNNRIGLLLLNNGLIDEQALDTCLAESRKRQQGIGKTLVQEGHLTLKQLNGFLLEQAKNSLYNVFLWESGEFSYDDQQINLKGMAGQKMGTMNILLEASRRIDELGVLQKQIPDPQAVVKRVQNAGSPVDSGLQPMEQRILALVDGRATVRQILDSTGCDDFTGYKALNSLLSAGHITIIAPMTLEEIARRAVTHLRGIDARQFRETLDSLEVKRSSVLRIALSGLFREAADADQLMAAAEAEAAKIAGEADRQALRRLREDAQAPFIRFMSELLRQSLDKKQ